ncbi:MAG: ribonuclease T2 [Edaphobacter sp.]|uniref:ribonuclease T2 n=1 Tax=Edaphobacter sp. TaxID=1934404 RepID=UPI00238CBFDE|nr:ribonuclease T2 [Edaphobacter sp.]MDE1177588.1 ribonuclease T2 [Edaphobacter sp.]
MKHTEATSRHHPCYPSLTMKKAALILSLLLAAFSLILSGCDPHPSPTPEPKPTPRSGVAQAQSATEAPQSFDYYLLNLSWSPEFCHSHPTNVQCGLHSTFVLHGLWPQQSNGSYQQNCSTAPGPTDPSQYKDLYPDPSLLQHEWKTHGTCSGLAPDAYFTAARKALQSVTIPTKLSQLDHQISLPPEQILALFTAANPDIPRDAMALSCGNNYLTAVEVCLSKQLTPMSCGSIRSCRANSVRIPAP